MGSTAAVDDVLMCYNAANMSQLGWLRNLAEYGSKPSGSLTLVGHTNYGGGKQVIRLRGTPAGSDTYVWFNHASGINSGTREGQNQIIVTTRTAGLSYSTTKMVAKLGVGRGYNPANAYYTVLRVTSIDLALGQATISFKPAPPTLPPTRPPTPPPTRPPTSSPTLMPLEPPTPAPVEPTPAPVELTPAPVEPTPAPVEPTLAPVEPTPTPVEPPTLRLWKHKLLPLWKHKLLPLWKHNHLHQWRSKLLSHLNHKPPLQRSHRLLGPRRQLSQKLQLQSSNLLQFQSSNLLQFQSGNLLKFQFGDPLQFESDLRQHLFLRAPLTKTPTRALLVVANGKAAKKGVYPAVNVPFGTRGRSDSFQLYISIILNGVTVVGSRCKTQLFIRCKASVSLLSNVPPQHAKRLPTYFICCRH
jgi:hypothetical protein